MKYSVYSLNIYNDLDESKIIGSSVFLFHALLHRVDLMSLQLNFHPGYEDLVVYITKQAFRHFKYKDG